jgi:hypothetical protein
MGVREAAQRRDHRVDRRQQNELARAGQQPRVTQVVDVLGRAADVHQLEQGGRRASRGEPFAHVVLDGLHVVVDPLLDRLHRRRHVVAGIAAASVDAGRDACGQRASRSSCGTDAAISCSHSASTRPRARISAPADSSAAGAVSQPTIASVHGRERGQRGECGVHSGPDLLNKLQ